MHRAVFLDRDGVINRAIVKEGKPYPPADISETEILPGVPESLQRLHNESFLIIIVTNQPDVARGTTKKETVEEINKYLEDNLIIDEFRTCFHDNDDNCDCRKPLPGSLLAAARDHHITLSESFMVGDRWRDVEAGRSAGCKTIFIDYGYNEKQPEKVDHKVKSLKEAVNIILGEKNEKN